MIILETLAYMLGVPHLILLKGLFAWQFHLSRELKEKYRMS